MIRKPKWKSAGLIIEFWFVGLLMGASLLASLAAAARSLAGG